MKPQYEEQLDFGEANQNQVPMSLKQKEGKKLNKLKKELTFHEAQEYVQQEKIEKIQSVKPMTAPPPVPQKKPVWNEKVSTKPGVFDPSMGKNEIFRAEGKLKQQRDEIRKEQERKIAENPPKSAIKSYENLREIEEAISKVKYKKDTNIMKKQEKEIQQLQWMIDQERRLKRDQNKLFEKKMKEIRNEPKKGSKKDSKKQSKSQQKQKSENKFDRNVDDYLNPDVWQDSLAIIQHQAKKPIKEEYDVDLIPMKENQQQNKQYSDNKVIEKPLPRDTMDNKRLQEELLAIQKRELQRQHELDALIDKHQLVIEKESKNPNKQYQEINKKLDKLRNKMEPVLRKLNNVEPEFPFTGHLLARSVQKLVQLHSEKLADLIVDDILIESAQMLNKIEEREIQEIRKVEQQMAIQDYLDAVQDLAMDQELIEKNFQISKKEYMDRDPRLDAYTPVVQLGKDQHFFINPSERVRSIEVSSGFVMRILEERRNRIEYIKELKIYGPKNLERFSQYTEEILDELLMERAMNMWQSSDELAEQIFINEFK